MSDQRPRTVTTVEIESGKWAAEVMAFLPPRMGIDRVSTYREAPTEQEAIDAAQAAMDAELAEWGVT